MEDSGYETYQDPRLQPTEDEDGEEDTWADWLMLKMRSSQFDNRPVVRVKLDYGAYLPVRAHGTDAGADIFTPESFVLKAHSSEIIYTGVHLQLPRFTAGKLESKSGLNVKHGIIGTGLIDEGYDGAVVVKLYNLSDEDYTFHRGDKIIQLVIERVAYPTYVEVAEIQGGERGAGGFGSTGR